MVGRIAWRMLTEVDPRLLWKFAYGFGACGMRAVRRFERRARRGEHFPAFLFISVTNRCNLTCQGCWVRPTQPPQDLDPVVIDQIIRAARKQGSHFFGILGGEPLARPAFARLRLTLPPGAHEILTPDGRTMAPELDKGQPGRASFSKTGRVGI